MQQWHQPSRKRKSNPCTLENIKFIKAEYGKEKKILSTNYDPRPLSLRTTTTTELQQFRQSLETPVGLLHVLPANTICEESDISLTCTPRSSQLQVQAELSQEPQPISLAVLYKYGLDFLSKIKYSEKEMKDVEAATRKQSQCTRWYEEHHCRITASNFGMMCKGAVTTSKVKLLLYNGFDSSGSKQSNSAILWGKLHEPSAFHQYKSTLPDTMVLQNAGIYISKHGFLAASPDGVITDNGVNCGIIEIKCPYSCRNMTVHEACSKTKFYCQLINNEVKLNHNHAYYYQIQGTMALVGVEWCDFIVWTINDMTVERIPFNRTFWHSCYYTLQSIYMRFILPEIIYPRVSLDLDIIEYNVHINKSTCENEP